MLENLKLPLCPKCGDTKNVKDKIVDESKLTLHSNYECTVCDISWMPYKIVDNKVSKTYNVWHGEMPSNRLVRHNPLKWWRTLTEDVR